MPIEDSAALGTLVEAYRSGLLRPSDAVDLAIRAARESECRRWFVSVSEEAARSRALVSDQRWADKRALGPLDGVPIAIKDNFDVVGEVASAGSLVHAAHRGVTTASAVARLVQAGAVSIGRTNMHEVALGGTGDVSAHGAAQNPWDAARMTGGSSSGSAAAVAAGVVPLALGSDTGGSIRIPAALCGVVGMKPTRGLVPSDGLIELSASFDTVGPLTRTVRDNAVALEVLVQAEGRFTAMLDAGVGGLVVGIPDTFYNEYVAIEVQQGVERAARVLAAAGAEIRDVAVEGVQDAYRDQRLLLSHEAYLLYRDQLEMDPSRFSPELFERLRAGASVGLEAAALALGRRDGTRERFVRAFDDVDVLLTPTTPVTAPRLGQRRVDINGTWRDVTQELARLTAPSNYLDVPSLAVPVGVSSEGLPLGVQLIGPSGSEADLYRVGRVLERPLSPPHAPRITS